jgi:hypothetical protein
MGRLRAVGSVIALKWRSAVWNQRPSIFFLEQTTMEHSAAFSERHYTVDEVAEMWSLSRESVRKMFLSEPDVLKIARPGSRYKRSYVTMRIPESVLNRGYRRMCAGRVA